MAKAIIAHPGSKSTSYVDRGRELYAEHALEIIASHDHGVYMVPSGSEPGKVYEVRPGRSCECIARDYRDHCSHDMAATMAHAKSFACDGCQERYPNTERVEVGSDSLTHFEGEELCLGCALAGGEA